MPDSDRSSNDDLDALLATVQDRIYALALRMLWHPEDARDATQEILLRIVRHRESFRGESAFSTWCYAIAANYLRTAAKSRAESPELTFASFEDDLFNGACEPADTLTKHPDYAIALEEVKIGCTMGMLLCLDRDHRLAYILGEILELESPEAAKILDITPDAFRQRLSRARKAIVEFTSRVCGVVREDNPCQCRRRLTPAIALGRVTLGAVRQLETLRERTNTR